MTLKAEARKLGLSPQTLYNRRWRAKPGNAKRAQAYDRAYQRVYRRTKRKNQRARLGVTERERARELLRVARL